MSPPKFLSATMRSALKFSVSGDRDPGPAFGRQVAGPVGQHIADVVHRLAGDDDADIVRAFILVTGPSLRRQVAGPWRSTSPASAPVEGNCQDDLPTRL